MAMNLTDVAYAGSYGTYKIDTSNLKMNIDPKTGTTHTTALYITGNIVITFTPNSVAPQDVKDDAVPSTFQFTLTNDNWLYEGKKVITLAHTDAEDIDWGDPDDKGVKSGLPDLMLFTLEISTTSCKSLTEGLDVLEFTRTEIRFS